MAEEELNIWELREILSSYGDGSFEYIVNDYQKNQYGQPALTLGQENDGNIYAYIQDNDGQVCLCQIKSKEQLIKLKEVLV